MTRSDDHVVLIGMMGAGKSTIGRRLAGRLDWAFWDNDEALRAATGQTAAEVQQAHGQPELHRLENELLREALARRTPAVLAAAGSVVLEPELVDGVLTVWLRISEAREAANLARSGQHHRPLPADPDSLLRQMAAQREPLYARVADITVDVAADANATFDRVLGALTSYPELPAAVRAALASEQCDGVER
jgi:shikimate kinase